MDVGRSSAPDTLKALGDPVRWTIVQHVAKQPELAGSVLDEALSISRPTISYHIRILTQAGLVGVSKRGRNHFYTLRHDVLRDLVDELQSLIPSLRLAPDVDATVEAVSTPRPPAREAERAAVYPTW